MGIIMCMPASCNANNMFYYFLSTGLIGLCSVVCISFSKVLSPYFCYFLESYSSSHYSHYYIQTYMPSITITQLVYLDISITIKYYFVPFRIKKTLKLNEWIWKFICLKGGDLASKQKPQSLTKRGEKTII